LLKALKEEITLPLTTAINKSLESGIFPDKFKIANVVPIFKAKDKQEFSNYRPISLLSNVSKLLEKIVHRRLYKFMNDSNILYSSQYGFRNNHSTIQAITELVGNILKGFDKKEVTLSIFLDLSKAFDTIDHSILLNKLEHYGIRGLPLQWLKSYLSGRRHYVEYKGVKSDLMSVSCGVPQGSVLGPLLFIIYTNDLANVSKLISTILFADDTTLYCTGKDLNILVNNVNRSLIDVVDWFRANKLSLNICKTNFILFHSRNMDMSQTNIDLVMGDIHIERVNNGKFLGMILDNLLEWQSHICSLESKMSKQLYILNKVKKGTPKRKFKITLL